MNLSKALVLLFVILLLTECKNQEKNTVGSVEATIEKQLGDSYEKLAKGTFTIYQSSLQNGRIAFLVLNEDTQAITYGPVKINGFVSWHEEAIVKVQETPEVIQDKDGQKSFVYYIDAKTGKKTTLNQK
ncbi:MAG: hypothetical protein HRT61_08940 [Ekhidna sp.]|nr:hypothetical protein [Ekhidna sp.]